VPPCAVTFPRRGIAYLTDPEAMLAGVFKLLVRASKVRKLFKLGRDQTK